MIEPIVQIANTKEALTRWEPKEVRDQVLKTVKFILVNKMGTTNDRGSSLFDGDTTTGRKTACAKICAWKIVTKKLNV